MDANLAGRVAIVTGAGRGIGRAIAVHLARAGAAVVVATRTASHGEETVRLIRADGGSASLHLTTLESRQAVRALVDYAIAAHGDVTIVVHNAALAVLRPLEELTEDLLDDTFNVNVKAGIWLTLESLPSMKRQGSGRVLFTSSVTAQRALPNATAYAVSKAGLHGFIRNAALELGRYRITVNGIEPGIIRTDALEKHHFSEDDLRRLHACIPLGEFGTPDDVAAAMVYLAGEGGRYVTGQTIVVDGGMLLPETGALMMR